MSAGAQNTVRVSALGLHASRDDHQTLLGGGKGAHLWTDEVVLVASWQHTKAAVSRLRACFHVAGTGQQSDSIRGALAVSPIGVRGWPSSLLQFWNGHSAGAPPGPRHTVIDLDVGELEREAGHPGPNLAVVAVVEVRPAVAVVRCKAVEALPRPPDQVLRCTVSTQAARTQANGALTCPPAPASWTLMNGSIGIRQPSLVEETARAFDCIILLTIPPLLSARFRGACTSCQTGRRGPRGAGGWYAMRGSVCGGGAAADRQCTRPRGEPGPKIVLRAGTSSGCATSRWNGAAWACRRAGRQGVETRARTSVAFENH